MIVSAPAGNQPTQLALQLTKQTRRARRLNPRGRVILTGCFAQTSPQRADLPEVDYVVSDSGAKLVLAAIDPLPDGAPYADETLAAADLAAIFYTSGTTGFPKGRVQRVLNRGV